jgi:protocatechuate 3,4-dioxygenase beta subunit
LSAVLGRTGTAIGVNPATVDADGTFRFTGVAPGRYRMSASVPGAAARVWMLRSAVVDGHDAIDVPIDVGSTPLHDVAVTFTDKPSDLSGRILDGAGHPAPEYFIILFASDQSLWTGQSRWIQAKRPASDGRFTFPNMQPGNYYLAAVTDVEQGEWYDPAFLAQLAPASIKVAIAEGETKTQDIQLATGK